jgi:diguanylate cyclase (GGDEF)-like protein
LLAPLVVGHFSRRQEAILALAEAACLVAVGAGIVLLVRRLRSSHEALWALARRDELTGVGNYRALHERLATEIARHQRHGREFAVVLLDLDGFKQVNERYGHLEGDRLLAEIGSSLRREVRGEDSVFRQGGDEFAVIVPEVNAEEAGEVAKRLRGRVAARGFGSDELRPLSAATGFAMFPADGRSVDELLSVADADLFAAKPGARARGLV